MKFTILINQKALIDSGMNLDIVDLAIFELLKDFSLTDRCKKLNVENTTYFLFNWKLVNNQLPILGLNSRQSVFKRFEKLKENNIIVAHPDNSTLGQSWYTFGANYSKLLFLSVNESLQGSTKVAGGDNESLPEPVNNGLHNKSSSDNIINNKSEETPEQMLRKKKADFCLRIVEFEKVNPDKYPKLMYLDFVKYWTEKNTSGKKMRFEDQQFFEVARRLSTWFKKCKDVDLTLMKEQENNIAALPDLLRSLF